MLPPIATARSTRTLLAPLFIIFSVGCGNSWSGNRGSSLRTGLDVHEETLTSTRTMTTTLMPNEDGIVEIRNLAGTVTITQDDTVDAVTVNAMMRGDRLAEDMIPGMSWLQQPGSGSGTYWTLDYPLMSHRSYHYQWGDDQRDDAGFELRTNAYDGRELHITTTGTRNAPTLFADLDIRCPTGTTLRLMNLAGHVKTVGAYEGDLDVRVMAGAVDIEHCAGRLAVDAGAYDVRIGTASGEIALDGGSGTISAGRLSGSAVIDTGSGDVHVERSDGASLRVDAGSGSVHLMTPFSERVEVDTGSGRILIDTLGALRFDADTGSGDVHIGGGDAEQISIDSGSGDVDLRECDFETMTCDTNSGNITIESTLHHARTLDLSCGSGDVRLVAPPHASFTLDAEQGSGRLTVGYRDATTRTEHGKLIGASHGDGRGVKISVDTGSGDCIITPYDAPSG